jgi:hypothetical protein
MKRLALVAFCLAILSGKELTAMDAAPPRQPQTLETPAFRFRLAPEDGRWELLDKASGVVWRSNHFVARFGEATCTVGGKARPAVLGACELEARDGGLVATFRPVAGKPDAALQVSFAASADGKALAVSYTAAKELALQSVRLFDAAGWVTDAEQGYAALPVREGLLIPADNGLAFSHRFGTYDYEGCHMTMLGLVKSGSALLVTWDSPYVAVEIKSRTEGVKDLGGKQVLLPSLDLTKSATSFRLQVCGKGDYVTLAQAYRPLAKEKGWLVPWEEKLKAHPDDAKLFGAINYKLWSTLSRQMNKESTKEENARVNWTFDEAAQVAEHLKNDLKLERVLFTLGGWIRRGYDNQHPDILPSAPECGGDTPFADCAKRVMALGYLFCLHDNYQDIYRDAPSWDESYIMKRADGKIAAGGHWAGGLAYLTCAKRAVDLAKRPQNLAAVRKLTGANSYFIDTTYAAGLQECFDPQHPLTKDDDMKWKQVLSDYARETFGVFGSECGREWAIPHADFFEGLTGVSGGYYHDAKLLSSVGGTVIPLFELVYRDTIAMYGKYGYDPSRAAEYVLQHLAIGRPLNYHNIPAHLYWKAKLDVTPLRIQPTVEFQAVGPREFKMTYRWKVEKTPARDYRAFVHFTDAADAIKFQNDFVPDPALSAWAPGEVKQGPFTVKVPDGLSGTFQVRLGLFDPESGQRARLAAGQDGQNRVTLGQLTVAADGIRFAPAQAAAEANPGDPGVFVNAEGGWAEGLHPMDRFVKNTYEILSPLNELTAQVPMTQHQFLSPDRKVQRSVFGSGAAAVEVVVNASAREYKHAAKTGGEVLLPPYGFVIEGPAFAAFHALSWNGQRYDAPAFFTLRSLDDKPLAQSARVRVYHGFGDARIKLGGSVRTVAKEETLAVKE